MDALERNLKEYRAAFGVQFPLLCVMGLDDTAVIKLIKEALENGKQYKPELKEGILY